MFTCFSSEEHKFHFPQGELAGGRFVRPYECPERWDYIKEALVASGHTDFRTPAPPDMERVAAVHTQDYLEFLQTAWQQWLAEGFEGEAIPTVFPARRMQQKVPQYIDGKLGYYAMAVETAITAGSFKAAQSSVACALSAQQLVKDKSAEVFALCRPPGHHAASDLYGGYCFINNAAVAAQVFLDDGAARVAILDVDFHHGNGTQDIFYHRDDVLFLSLHGDPEHAFPHFLGYADETGAGKGEGYNFNYPMLPGTHYDVWQKTLEEACNQILKFSPDALVISLGVDTFEKDPISFFKLSSEDFIRCGAQLGAMALPTLFVMEGGYAVEEIGINTANVLTGFSETVS